jgi:gamma-glutamylcyclotransferase
MLYFAYGSNMSTTRLNARIPSASLIGTGRLQGYRLAFHKVSMRDGSGKCDARFTGDKLDAVFGVLYDCSNNDLARLDKIEGVGQGYEAKTLNIDSVEGLVQAQTYFATNIDAALKPMLWYKEHVIRGATEHKLPAQYIEYIDRIEAIIDLDEDRAARERSLYITG